MSAALLACACLSIVVNAWCATVAHHEWARSAHWMLVGSSVTVLATAVVYG